MSEATEVQQDEDAIIEAAKKAEIAENAGIELPAEETQYVPAEQSEDDVQQEEEKPAEPTLEERLAALAEENKRLRRDIDTTNGRYGSHLQKLNKEIESLRNRPVESNSFTGFDLDSNEAKELMDEYPDLIPKLFAAMGKTKQAEQKVTEQPKQETQEHAPVEHDQFSRELALERLYEKHPDFEVFAKFKGTEIAPGHITVHWNDPNFGAFVETLDDDDRNVIMSGDSPSDILRMSKIFTQYKKTQKPSEESSNVTDEPPAKEKIKPDLSKSLLPQGRVQSGKVHMTEDEIIEAARKAEMRRQIGL